MKKLLSSILIIHLILLLASCRFNSELLNCSSSNTDYPQGSNSMGILDLDAIMSGQDSSDVYSNYTAEQKSALIEAAKADGVDVTFNADGSTTFKDNEGTEVVQKADGSWVIDDGEGQLGGSWPDNEFTKLLPKPDFKLLAANTEDNAFTVMFSEATIEQIRAYTGKVKAAGFTVDAETEDEELMGIVMYGYTASNSSGYSIEIFSAAGACGLTISK